MPQLRTTELVCGQVSGEGDKWVITIVKKHNWARFEILMRHNRCKTTCNLSNTWEITDMSKPKRPH